MLVYKSSLQLWFWLAKLVCLSCRNHSYEPICSKAAHRHTHPYERSWRKTLKFWLKRWLSLKSLQVQYQMIPNGWNRRWSGEQTNSTPSLHCANCVLFCDVTNVDKLLASTQLGTAAARRAAALRPICKGSYSIKFKVGLGFASFSQYAALWLLSKRLLHEVLPPELSDFIHNWTASIAMLVAMIAVGPATWLQVWVSNHYTACLRKFESCHDSLCVVGEQFHGHVKAVLNLNMYNMYIYIYTNMNIYCIYTYIHKLHKL